MLTKPAEKEVRRQHHIRQAREWVAPLAVAEMFRVDLSGYLWSTESQGTKFRIMSDGSIQSPVYDFSKENDKGGYDGKWTPCAKPPQGDLTQ